MRAIVSTSMPFASCNRSGWDTLRLGWDGLFYLFSNDETTLDTTVVHILVRIVLYSQDYGNDTSNYGCCGPCHQYPWPGFAPPRSRIHVRGRRRGRLSSWRMFL